MSQKGDFRQYKLDVTGRDPVLVDIVIQRQDIQLERKLTLLLCNRLQMCHPGKHLLQIDTDIICLVVALLLPQK